MSARPKAKATAKKTARRTPTTKLLVAMTGKASAAKAAEGDKPVFAYIASLPQRSAKSPSASMPSRPGRCQASSAR
jgi:hypothetical protein